MEREIICPYCGRKFTSTAWNTKYCPDCRYRADLAKQRENRELRKRKKLSDPIVNAVIDLEEYNRIHDTNYSYGQAVAKGII